MTYEAQMLNRIAQRPSSTDAPLTKPERKTAAEHKTKLERTQGRAVGWGTSLGIDLRRFFPDAAMLR